MRPFRENDVVAKMLGTTLFVLILPLIAVQILAATAWEIVDVRVVGLQRLCTWINARLRFGVTIHAADSFMFHCMLLNGVLLPVYLLVEACHTRAYGFDWQRMLLYNILRFGPNVSNFAYVNTLIHKCCHSRVFKHKLLDSVFEFWIGVLYGVVPGNYSLSHVYNHHKHDNSIEDVITVIDFRRDSFLAYLGYSYRYLVYTLNVSSTIYFYNQRDSDKCLKSGACTAYYVGCVALAGWFAGTQFAVFYLLYPMLQGNLIISAINYTWHAFVHEGDEQNRLINSTTIVDGEYFILEEQYHAVHHMRAGVHWSKHKAVYQQHAHQCCAPTVFYRLHVFELFGMVVTADYEGLARNSGIDPSIIKMRLQHTLGTRSSHRATSPPSSAVVGTALRSGVIGDATRSFCTFVSAANRTYKWLAMSSRTRAT